jgi:hypothetical protein
MERDNDHLPLGKGEKFRGKMLEEMSQPQPPADPKFTQSHPFPMDNQFFGFEFLKNLG